MLEHQAAGARAERSVVLGSAGFVAGAVRKRLESAGAPHLAIPSAELDLLADGAAEALAGRLQAGDALVVVPALAPCRDGAMLVQNLRMLEAVCAALKQQPVSHVVYISSDAVYADEISPLTEESCPVADNLHGVMHRAREVMLASAAGAPLAILRPSLLYGAADPHNGYGPNRFRRVAAEGGRIQLFGEGEEKRDHVFIDDLAELVWRVLQQRSQGLLNVATGVSTSFRGVAEQVAARFERAVEVAGQPRQNPITHRHFDVTAVHKAFPDFRFTPLAEGLDRAHREDPSVARA